MEPHRNLLDWNIESTVHYAFLPIIETTFEISSRKAAMKTSVLITTGTIFCYTGHAMRQMLYYRNTQGRGSGGIFVLASLVNTDIIFILILCYFVCLRAVLRTQAGRERS